VNQSVILWIGVALNVSACIVGGKVEFREFGELFALSWALVLHVSVWSPAALEMIRNPSTENATDPTMSV
jgi:hypothetical protein